MMSKVAFLKVIHEHKGVQKAVKRALDLINWRGLIKGENIFVKVNLISSEFVPGQCTSPLVLDGLLQELSRYGYEVTLGDSDLSSTRQCNKASKVWGHSKLAEKYGFRFQNLSEDESVKATIDGKLFKRLDIPRSIMEADTII